MPKTKKSKKSKKIKVSKKIKLNKIKSKPKTNVKFSESAVFKLKYS